MNNAITVQEARTPEEISRFWQRLHTYHKRDIFPDPNSEDLAYFLSEDYRRQIELLHERTTDPCFWLFFRRDDQEVGFALTVLYDSEDGKCFLMEFCVEPEFRGNGTGGQCAAAFLDWARSRGACYFELNCHTAQRQRFWRRLGFRPNGADEWGVPLMLLPPEKTMPVTVEKVSSADWQLWKLENGFLAEIGESPLTEENQQRLTQAVQEGAITFFLAMQGSRAVGMCSVSRSFSTFACAEYGIFDDFFIEPVFRRKGIARRLVQTAQNWCRAQGFSGLQVCCAPCDEAMYQALGFDMRLGSTFTANF